MKSVAIIVGVACAAVTVQGFAPVAPSSTTTALQGSLFDGIAGMDLYAPKKDQNEYGARKKKKVSDLRSIYYTFYSSNSWVVFFHPNYTSGSNVVMCNTKHLFTNLLCLFFHLFSLSFVSG